MNEKRVKANHLECPSKHFITGRNFRENPTFAQVIPERSIESGGIIVDVVGTGFKLLQRPHMVVRDEKKVMKGPQCNVVRDDLIFCKTPSLEIPHNRFMKNHSYNCFGLHIYQFLTSATTED